MPKLSISSQSQAIPRLEGHTATAPSSRGRGAGERIPATATELFARFGEDGVCACGCASAAPVNVVTVSRHYPRKRDLYLAVLESERQQLRFRGDLLTRIADVPDGRATGARDFDLLTPRP